MKFMLTLCLAALTAVAALFVRVGFKADAVQAKILWIQQRLDELEHKPVTATDTWTSGSTTITVSTERKKNSDGSWAETVDAWKARHDADVAAAKAAFPPNTGG